MLSPPFSPNLRQSRMGRRDNRVGALRKELDELAALKTMYDTRVLPLIKDAQALLGRMSQLEKTNKYPSLVVLNAANMRMIFFCA